MKKVKEPKKVHDSKTEHPNNNAVEETPNSASVSISVSSNENNNNNNNISREDIELVQNLIERCIQFYMNKAEVVKTLLSRARIDPRFTKLVWQKLEEENASFFRAYYIRLKMMKQIILFNRLLEHQHRLMHYSVPQGVNAAHPVPANNIPIGYPILQQPQVVPSTGQPSSFHPVTGVPVPANIHPFENNVGIENSSTKADDVTPFSPRNNAMSDMPGSPTWEDHFPFNNDIEILPEVDTSPHDMGNSLGLENGAGDSKNSSLQSLGQMPWDFSLSDLTADLSNLEDLGYLGNYSGSPFLLSDSDIDIVLDSEAEDLVDKFFAESDCISAHCSPSDEEKS